MEISECIVCFEQNPKRAWFLLNEKESCGHSLCTNCMNNKEWNNCPICGQNVVGEISFKIENEFHEIMVENQKLKKEILIFKERNESIDEKDLLNEIKKLREKCSELDNKLKDSSKKFLKIQDENSGLQKVIQILENDVQNYEKEVKNEKDKQEYLQNLVFQLQDKKKSLKEEKTKNRKSIQELQERINYVNDENETQKLFIESLQQQKSQVSNASGEDQSIFEVLDKMRDENKILTLKIKELEEEVTSKDYIISLLQET